MIVEFELVKRETDQVIKRLVRDVCIDGYKKLPDKVEELLQEGFVIADNRLIEETDTVQMTWEKDPRMQRFLAYDARVRNELIVYVNKYNYIETVYVRSPEEFNLYSQYCSAAHGNDFSGDIKIDKNYFRDAPDWYFLEKDKGYDDLDYYWFETLSEKKEQFNAFVKELDEIAKGATCS